MTRIRTGQRAGTPMAARLRWSAAAAIALSAVLTLTLVAVVAGFALPVPHSDHWGMLRFLLGSLDNGESLLRVLWTQYGEHRLVLLRLTDLAVIRWFHGNFHLEVYLSLALAAATGGMLWWSLAQRMRSAHPAWAWWTLAGMTAFALGPNQMENWAFPIEQHYLWLNFGILGGFVLLGSAPLSRARILGALGFGVIAALSNPNGLLFWPVALILVWLNTDRRRRVWVSGGWAILSACIWAAYLWEFKTIGGIPSPLALLTGSGALLQFFLVVVGHPIGAFVRPQDAIAPVAVAAFGVLGVALFGRVLWRGRLGLVRDPQRAMWLAIVGHSLLAAAAITVGRIWGGMGAAFPTRYITVLWPFWAGNLALLTLEEEPPALPDEPGRWLRRVKRLPLWQVGWGAVIVIGVVTFNTHVQRWQSTVRDIQASVAELPDVCQGNAGLIGRLGVPESVAETMPLLVRHGLLSFPPEAFAGATPGSGNLPSGPVESVRLEPVARSKASGRCWRVAGHVPPLALPAREVLLVGGNQVLKRAWVGSARPRVETDYDQDPHPESGWTLYLGSERLPKGLDRLEVHVLSSDGQVRRLGTVDLRVPADAGAGRR